MAKLLTDWLNNEVKLSKRIESLDNDFADGYLLGELLMKFNQQDNFESFLNKDNPDARINNFCLIEPTMRQIGVLFNSKLAYDIMHCKKDVMKNLLFEIKVSLDKIVKMAPPAVKMDGTKTRGPPMRVIHSVKPKFDNSMHNTFESVVRRDMVNPNELFEEKALRRFDESVVDNCLTKLTMDYQREYERYVGGVIDKEWLSIPR